MPAEKCVELVAKKLEQFGITLDQHIVGTPTGQAKITVSAENVPVPDSTPEILVPEFKGIVRKVRGNVKFFQKITCPE